MIYLKMRGRLGNQMFQYAFARSVSLKTGEPISIDWEIVDERTKIEQGNFWGRELNEFNIKAKEGKFEANMNFIQRQLFGLSNRYLKKAFYSDDAFIEILYKFASIFGLYIYQDGYIKYPFWPKSNKFLYAYFESPLYFEGIADELRREFTPRKPLLEHNKELFDIIKNTESICVTVRRGDFLEQQNINNIGVCGVDYYKRGVALITEKYPNANVILFSDDIEWVKQNIEFSIPTYSEIGSDPVWEKLRLMSACRHFVISNSTFSWWAQFLSVNTKKIVVAPDPWRADARKTDIEQENWIKIDRN